jgi:5'-methylthioadenosine phosphorylase
VIDAWSRLAGVELADGGVYWQAVGPRFETPAEIRLIAAHADVVGMTVAAESVVARELGLRYSVICMVDNLANGVGERELTLEELDAGRASNRERLGRGLARVLPELAGENAE